MTQRIVVVTIVGHHDDPSRPTGLWLSELTHAWQKEVLARVDSLVPYNVEQRAKERGARYEKARSPFVSHVVVDGNLVIGQNTGSAKATARAVAESL